MFSRMVPKRTAREPPGRFMRAARLARLVCHADADPARSLFSAGVWTLYDFAGHYIVEVTDDGLVAQSERRGVQMTGMGDRSTKRRTAYFRCPVCGEHYAAPEFDCLAHAATCLGASISLLDLVPAFVMEHEF
jgi:hypothetical protein